MKDIFICVDNCSIYNKSQYNYEILYNTPKNIFSKYCLNECEDSENLIYFKSANYCVSGCP